MFAADEAELELFVDEEAGLLEEKLDDVDLSDELELFVDEELGLLEEELDLLDELDDVDFFDELELFVDEELGLLNEELDLLEELDDVDFSDELELLDEKIDVLDSGTGFSAGSLETDVVSSIGEENEVYPF